MPIASMIQPTLPVSRRDSRSEKLILRSAKNSSAPEMNIFADRSRILRI